MTNLLYVYLFGKEYYTKDDLQYNTKRISYAMSFSSAAIFTISLSQLITSYAEFNHLLEKHEARDIEISQQHSRSVASSKSRMK